MEAARSLWPKSPSQNSISGTKSYMQSQSLAAVLRERYPAHTAGYNGLGPLGKNARKMEGVKRGEKETSLQKEE